MCRRGSASGPTTQADSVLALTPVASGLNFPVFLTAPPGDTTRLFVVEKAGVIRIVKNGVVLPTPFLDITALTTKSSEQGLLGLAFPPDYATSGRFYVSYTATGGGAAGHSAKGQRHSGCCGVALDVVTFEKILVDSAILK